MGHDFFFACEERQGSGVLLPPQGYREMLEVMLVLRGSVRVETAMGLFSAESGELLFLPPDLVRTVVATSDMAQLRVIRFSSILFHDMEERIDNDLFYMFLMQCRTRANRILPNTSLYIPLRRYFENCYGEYISRELCYSLRIRGQLTLMMALMLSSYSTTTKENDHMVYQNVLRLRPALDVIDTQYREKISVPQLAEMLLVTPDYFTRLFRDSIGKTTVDYINSVRINRSMMLLLQTDLPISEIATEVGLVSGNYFSKLFRKTLGIPPLAYRKSASQA